MTVQQLQPAFSSFAQRQSAQRAHEGDRLDAGHGRIKAALFGEVPDLMRRLQRACPAEQAPLAGRGVDDAEQHAEARCFACAVGAEDAVDRAGRDRQAHPVDRARIAEQLDEIAGLDGGIAGVHGRCAKR